tara:strand:+ start:62 stop:898 length:837 start_codon:yes stop_codon:yes gene_type:complete
MEVEITEEQKTDTEENDDSEINEDFLEVEVPEVLRDSESPVEEGDDDDWVKVKGWYNELNFYSKIFQFFVEDMKETESEYGWYIIVISSITTLITLFTLEPFDFNESQMTDYNWGKNLGLSVLTAITTLIAAWVKKKGYVKRIQAIDKRISRLEKFLGLLDYQFRLVPRENRHNYYDFITEMRDEHNQLSIYSTLISPSEFTKTMYIITRYNAPLVNGSWPWYNTRTKTPRPGFAKSIIQAYESQYSCKAWCKSIICCSSPSLDNNPLIDHNKHYSND